MTQNSKINGITAQKISPIWGEIRRNWVKMTPASIKSKIPEKHPKKQDLYRRNCHAENKTEHPYNQPNVHFMLCESM